MKPIEAISTREKVRLVIEPDENVGYYLIVYPLDSCSSIADYLYDSLEDAYLEAKEKYGVQQDNWKIINKI